MRLLRLAPLLLVLSCWTNGNDELGLTAQFRVSIAQLQTVTMGGSPPPGAQFFPGKMPKSSGDLLVTDIDSIGATIYPGDKSRPLSGRVTTGAQVVAVGLEGDIGYWIIPVGNPDPQYPGESTFTATGAFSTLLSLGAHTIDFEAGDSKGHFGALNTQKLTASDVTSPDGNLSVHLTWDTESDLDLHVTQPDGTDIWAKHESAYTPAPGDFNPAPDLTNIGQLAFDSNGMCVIDGLRAEHAAWANGVPSGTYTVRVDAFSMCNQSYGGWKIEVETRTDPAKPGTIIATGSGVLYPSDTQFPHTDGSGVFVLKFTMP